MEDNTLVTEEMKEQLLEGNAELLSKNVDDMIKLGSAPEDVAAYHFQKFLPLYMIYIDKLPLRALRRMCKSLVAYPLEDLKHKHTTDLEKEALLLGEKLLESKYIMFMTNLNQMVMDEQNKQGNNDV